MNSPSTIQLGEIMVSKAGSVDPQKYPDEVFNLYSIPAFDSGEPEVVAGRLIGSSKQVVSPGDVLLSKIVPHIRRSWVVAPNTGKRIIASGEWIIFRSKLIDPFYLRHFLISNPFHVQFMSTVSGVGGSLLRARPEYVGKIKIPIPPLSEQRRIAAILDKADELRAKRHAALAKLDTVARAIFIEMFGKDGSHPTSAKVEPLGNYLSFVTSGGRGWAKFYASTGHRFIRSFDVQMNYVSDVNAAFVAPPDNAEARRTRVQSGDVLLTITGSRIGRVAPAKEQLNGAFISQHVAILRPDVARLDPHFLSFYLSLEGEGQRQIAMAQYGQTKPGLNFEQIRRFNIPVPSHKLQKDFTIRIAALEKVKNAYTASLDKMDHLFATLQHRAFRGEL